MLQCSEHKTVLHSPAARIAVELPAPPTSGSGGVCNSYLPSDSVFNRFMYVVQFLTRNGIYVLLDNQINFDTTAIENTAGWLQVNPMSFQEPASTSRTHEASAGEASHVLLIRGPQLPL
jgi:hypothetical protein